MNTKVNESKDSPKPSQGSENRENLQQAVAGIYLEILEFSQNIGISRREELTC